MAELSKPKKERIKLDETKGSSPTITPQETPSQNTEPVVDLSKVIDQSKQSLAAGPTKRTRRTKAEIEAERASGGAPMQQPQNPGAPMVDQDLTMVSEPLLMVMDKIICSKYFDSTMVSPKEDIAELAKNINKPLNVALPNLMASADPTTAALFTIGICIGGMYLGKFMEYEAKKEANAAPAINTAG